MGSKSRNPSRNGYQEKKRQELLDADKPLIALYVTLHEKTKHIMRGKKILS
jgi:hypothetical protein